MRKPPAQATTTIIHPETVDDLKDQGAALVPKVPAEALSLLRESRGMIAATIKTLRLSSEGEFGIMVRKLDAYLKANGGASL